MQKSYFLSRTLFYPLILLALLVTPLFAKPLASLTFEEVNNQTRNILSDLIFKPNNSLVKSKQNNTSEIWSRVRSRLNLTTNTKQPLYQRHIRSYSKHQDYINKVIKNASPYFYYILEEVERRGMPSEIALLPIIESDFNPHTRSHRGALGLWQIMPSLGKMHGLKQNAFYDGRKDIYESTKVALDHLQYLHKKFNGNWHLAIAAYNCGEGRLSRAIRQNRYARKSTDFWTLNLPKETSHFVPKLLALAAIIKSPKQYGVVLPPIPNKPVIARVNTAKPINMKHAAQLADISETQLRKLNPGIKRAITPPGSFHLVVPISDAHKFGKNTNKTLPKTATKPIIEKKSTTLPKSKYLNKKTNTKGDVTIIKSNQKNKKPINKKFHIVKKGESLPKISKKHRINIKKLLADNHLRSASSIIQPGQKLIIGTK